MLQSKNEEILFMMYVAHYDSLAQKFPNGTNQQIKGSILSYTLEAHRNVYVTRVIMHFNSSVYSSKILLNMK